MSTLQIAIVMTLVNTLFWIALNFGLAFGVRLFPGKWFDHTRGFYRERKFEKSLYGLIKVRRWKDRLPEAGGMAGFSKRSLSSLKPEYIDRFIRESCIAEVGHLLIGVMGFSSVLFCLTLSGRWSNIWIFLIIATLNLFIQMLFVVIQRYNRPRLERLKEWVIKDIQARK